MSKKMMKRSLALGALMAFVITGSAMAAENSVLLQTGSEKCTASEIVASDNGASNPLNEGLSLYRSYGLGVVSGEHTIDNSLKITNTLTGTNRNYGIAVEDGAILHILGSTTLSVTNSNDIRALRVNKNGYNVSNPDIISKIDFNDLTITASGNGSVNGIDSWYGGIVEVNGNTYIDVESSANGNTTASAANIGQDSKVVFGGETTYLKATNTGDGIAQTIGRAPGNNGIEKVEFNSSTSTTIVAKANSSAIGIVNFDVAEFTAGDVYINIENTGTSNNVRDAIGVKSNIDVKNTVNSFNVTVTGSGTDNGVVANNGSTNADGTAGLYALGKKMIIDAQSFNVTVNASESDNISNRSDSHGIIAISDGDVVVTSKNINVTVNDSIGEAYAVLAGWNDGDTAHVKGGNGNIVLGGDESVVTVNVTAKDATGIMARGQNGSSDKGSSITVNGSLLDIDVDGDASYGIYVGNGTNGNQTGKTSIAINSETTDILAKGAESYGIMNVSDGKLNINSNVTIEADTVLNTRGNAQTFINTKEDGTAVEGKTTVLKGDIAFDYATNSGTPVDAIVKISLDGEDSSWTGDVKMLDANDNVLTDLVVDGNGVKSTTDSTNFAVSNFTLNISDNAKWTTDGNSFVNNLNLNNGIVEVTGDETQKVLIGTLAGEGTLKVNDAVANQVQVANADDASLKVTTENQNVKLEDLTKVASTENGTVSAAKTVAITGGAVYDEISAEVTGYGKVSESVNKTVAEANLSANDMAAVGLMSWRAEMNDMNKRMGELRNANGEHGVWVRMVRGESEYNSVKNQYNQYQLGYDEKLSVDKRWTVGAAISYTDAENNFVQGNGESTNKALSIYGSKLNADGTFVDLIAKYARLENEFDIVSGMGDAEYDANGYSFSAEFGKRIQQGNGLWIEPQVELTYGKVGSADYVTAKGVKVAQDSMESLVGRVGFSLGKDIKDGNVYARASYLYDFEGETQAILNNDAVLKQDLGGGWWEVGVGANINLSKATYIYADVEKTFGGEVDTNWQWNLGVRYSF